jgi:hypothetical protein
VTNDRKIYRDGILSLMGGQDSGRNPALLETTQAALLVNGMVRGGFFETRYGFKKRTLVFENSEQQEWFEDNLFQGVEFFDPTGKTPMFVASVGGRIFKVDVLADYQVPEITPQKGTSLVGNFISPAEGASVTITVTDNATIHVGYPVKIGSGRYMVTAKGFNTITVRNIDAVPGVNVPTATPIYYLSPNPSLLPKIWGTQAENYLLIQNGTDGCIIYDGATCRRAVRNGKKLEIPTGTAMVYWQGRIWVTVNGKEIEAGDIYGGPTTILDFTETTYLAEGGRFRVPGNVGNITALKVLPVLDTSLGQGPLQIFTETSISALNLPVGRDKWKNIDSPVQPISLINYGATSQNGTVVVNGDVFFRAKDGIRSFVLARREFGTWGNVPVSREMQRILADDDQRFLQHGSAVLFDNLLLFTVNPLPFNSGRAAYWQGLGVLDFDLISSMGQKERPVYAGVWNGVQVMQITKGTFHGKERCFLFVRTAAGKNELWEVDPKSRFDNDCGRIKWVIESRSMDFGHPYQLHKLEASELWVDRIEGTVDFTLKFRKDQSPCWLDWASAPQQTCAVGRQCTVPADECFEFQQYQPGYKTRIGFGQPLDSCEEFDSRPARVGYLHEVRLEGEGHARVKGLIVKATEQTEPSMANCA